MKRAHPSILLVSAMLLMGGCKARETASNNPAMPTPAASITPNNANGSAETANANRNANQGKEADASATVKSGTFRVEPPDKLVLTIQVTGLKAKRQIQNPPLSKTHTFSLSPDGDELRFTSAKGSVGIFQRVAKPKTP